LKSVRTGQRSKAAALALIRTGRERADKVRRLLRELGDSDEDMDLKMRFNRTSRRLEHGQRDIHTATLFGELTLAVQDLNILLSEFFYD